MYSSQTKTLIQKLQQPTNLSILSLTQSLQRTEIFKSYHFIGYRINSSHFMRPDGSFRYSEGPLPPVPILSQINLVQPSPIQFLEVSLEHYLTTYIEVFQVVSFHLVSPPKPYTNFSSLPYVPHSPPISSSLVLSKH